MPTIFDLFGFLLDDRSEGAEAVRKARQCPFYERYLQRGRNRYQTEIMLTPAEPLTRYFNPGIGARYTGEQQILTHDELAESIEPLVTRLVYRSQFSTPLSK